MKRITRWAAVVVVNVIGIAIAVAAGEWYARDLVAEQATAASSGELAMCRPDALAI